jgi:ribosome-associated toxin RatA of RatAB toxin-antitoxin module
MSSYGECQSADIAATPQSCFDALTDFQALPQCQGAVRDVQVLERHETGRGTIVEYEVDVRFKTVRHRLREVYDEPRRLASEASRRRLSRLLRGVALQAHAQRRHARRA